MSLSIARSKIPYYVLTLASLLTVMTAPASAASMPKHKHSVYVVDHGPEISETPATTATHEIPIPESSKEPLTAATAQERVKDHVGDTETLGFQDFYRIPEPETQVQADAEAIQDGKTIYWFGAAGAALAAGVAAWFIFSSEPESRSTAAIIP